MSHLGDRLTALVDGQLEPAAQDKALAHLRHCADCRAAYDHELWVRRQLHQLPGAEPSAALLMALKDIGGDAAAFLDDDPARHWRLPSRRVTGMALAGAGTLAVSVLGLAYSLGPAQAQPVRPPVERFSSEFAGAGDSMPFSDPAGGILPILDRESGR
ncbi:MAG: anti-sigma factor family protein [Nocardioidaceae bacterium]